MPNSPVRWMTRHQSRLCLRPQHGALWDALPETRRGAHGETSQDFEDALVRDLRGGDVVMVKGSLGSRMMPLVEAIRARYPERAA
jgi:UDP-N-acetylmuramyl pentapeptide synthase